MSVALTPRGPFDLRRSIGFLDGFVPAGAPQADGATLRLAVRRDDGTAVGLAARQAAPDGPVVVTGSPGAGDDAARVLSLDVDASPLATIAEDDPVVARMLAAAPGLRPVLFPTPTQAAAWAILSQRQPRAQAARLRDALVAHTGDDVDCDGEVRRAFPAPERLAGLADDAVPGLWPVKAERLRALGAAAARGELDPGALRALEPDEALARLQRLPGIGPFGAALTLLRGVGQPDVPAPAERRLTQAVRAAYALDHDPDAAELTALADTWRPLRSWVAFLLRTGAGAP